MAKEKTQKGSRSNHRNSLTPFKRLVDKRMKMLKISDDISRKLIATVGTLMAQTGKMQTYQDAIEVMPVDFALCFGLVSLEKLLG